MSSETRSAVVSTTSTLESVAGVPALAGVFCVVVGWALVFKWVPATRTVAGVSVADATGGLLVGAGLLLAAVGLLGDTDRAPRYGAGPVVALAFGGLAFGAVGLLTSQTLGVGPAVWIPAAFLAGVVVCGASVAARERHAVTLPAAALDLLAGGAVVLGAVAPGWAWSPRGFSVTFNGTMGVAFFGVLCGLFTLWSAAVASRGFGARGRQRGAYALSTVLIATLLGILCLLVVFVVQKGLGPVLKGASLWPPAVPFVTNGFGLGFEVNGIFPAIVGTVWLVVGAVVLAVPLGVGAAVFLTEYAEQGRFTSTVEIATNGLWSTPSIVYGLFGYAFLVPRLGGNVSLLAGQLVLGFMLLPLVLITSREAIQNVPDEYRDASDALGVSRWQTIRSVVLPAALPGILTGVILGVGRIAGETAPILLVLTQEPFLREAASVLGGFRFQSTAPFVTNTVLLDSTTALPYQLFAVIKAGVQAPISFGWGTALVLLLVVLSFYAVGIATRLYFRRKLRH